MSTFRERIERAREAIARAEAIVVGGGAGLSAAAGLTYGGARFDANFADFRARYGFSDMYTGMFYPFPTPEELWAYRARHILVNRFEPGPAPLYLELLRLLDGKEWFVITTNVDSMFEKAGFCRDRLFEVQGNYGFLQCAKGCHDRLYGNESLVREMAARTERCRIPTELVPSCPVCGGEMAVHVRTDGCFVENEDWRRMQERYSSFLQRAAGRRTVFLELGVGFNTPGIIRFPFERMTFAAPEAVLLRCNRDAPEGFLETAERTVAFPEDIQEVLEAL